MNTWKIKLAGGSGGWPVITITAATYNDAVRIAEHQYPGYRVVMCYQVW